MNGLKLQEAIRLAEQGYWVFPLNGTTNGQCDCGHPDCGIKEAGKHPTLVTRWKHEATTDADKINSWWKKRPNANIAIATGVASDLLVVDCDVRQDGDGFAQLQKLDPEHRTIEQWKTVTAKTGSGGFHLYFRCSTTPLTVGTAIGGKHIDFRCEGGYIVAPPSVNGAGEYVWISAPGEVPVMDCPDWLLAFLKNGAGKRKQPEVSEEFSGTDNRITGQFTLETHPGVPAGDRNGTLCRLVGAALCQGQDASTIIAQAQAFNLRCSPPKCPDAIAKSVYALISSEMQKLRESHSGSRRNRRKQRSDEENSYTPPALVMRCSDDVEEESLRWLWQDRFLVGHINIIAGDPGLGKSLLAVDASARVSQGQNWPDGSACPKGLVLYCTTEDAFASVVKPRLSAAGADHKNIHFVEGVVRSDIEGALFLDEHMGLLDAELEKLNGQVRLLVVDTLQSYVGAETNTSNNASSRRIMTPLKRLAEKHSVAILCLEHLTKGPTGRNAGYRVQGSIAFIGAARSVWIVCKDPSDEKKRIVQAAKTNLSPDNEGLGLSFTVNGEVGRPRIVWGETNIRTPLSELMCEDSGGNSAADNKGQLEKAKAWIRDQLTEPVPAKVMEDGAQSDGFSKATIRRAKSQLGIESKKTAEGWVWLPPPCVSIGDEIVAGP